MTTPRPGWPEQNAAGPPVWTDPGFNDWLRRHPSLAPLRRHLPAGFDGHDGIHALSSSYFDRGYGSLFYALVRVLQPRRCVEIGLYQGFSLLTAAAALRDNGAGTIAGYDLFADYPFRHADRRHVSEQVTRFGLDAWTTLHQADEATVHEHWDAVDYLHVDVSNHGDTYRRVFEQWSGKVRQVILLEGGSRERDNVDWMLQYRKPAIGPALDEIRAAYPQWSVSVLEPFPSLTVAINRHAVAARQP